MNQEPTGTIPGLLQTIAAVLAGGILVVCGLAAFSGRTGAHDG